ncbi:MAG TPA: glycosyl transferase, partial [Xanthobacteraceae bacterium]|nr:glycosyl transferase [Xanthobacteraceae bacterium]
MPGAAWTLGCLALSAAVTFGLIVLLKPLLQRYALARPNARSSHTIPTPQG